MTKDFGPDNTPKTFSDAIGKVCKNVCLAAILGIIIYISILYIYRTIGSPNYAGYSTTTYTTSSDGKETENIKTYFFKEGEDHKLPENDETHVYSPIYSNDLFPEVLSQILMLCVYVLMLYSVAWAFGAHQHNSEQCAGRGKSKYVGVKLGLASSFMYFISYALLIIAKLGVPLNFAFPLFGLVNATYLPLLNAFTNGGPQGVVGVAGLIHNNVGDFSYTGVLVMIIPLIIKIIVCAIGYELGYKQVSIKEKLVFKTNN